MLTLGQLGATWGYGAVVGPLLLEPAQLGTNKRPHVVLRGDNAPVNKVPANGVLALDQSKVESHRATGSVWLSQRPGRVSLRESGLHPAAAPTTHNNMYTEREQGMRRVY